MHHVIKYLGRCWHTWHLLNYFIDFLHENLLEENQVVEQVSGQVMLKRANLHTKRPQEGVGLLVISPNNIYRTLLKRNKLSYLSHTAQIIPLQIVSLLGWEIVRCPPMVWVAIMVLHDVLTRHSDRWQGETGWWWHGRQVYWGHFWLEAELVIWQLKSETGLSPCVQKTKQNKVILLWLHGVPQLTTLTETLTCHAMALHTAHFVLCF